MIANSLIVFFVIVSIILLGVYVFFKLTSSQREFSKIVKKHNKAEERKRIFYSKNFKLNEKEIINSIKFVDREGRNQDTIKYF